MSPQTQDDGSLAFARNMKIDDDGNLVSDYGYKNISAMANYNIVGHIVGLDNKIYFFCHTKDVSKIVEYDEVEETATELTTTWTYSGGEIDGYVNTNQSGEKILTIGEYLPNGSEIPLKHINLKFANIEQSLYSQAPKCPTANLVLKDTYVKTIPNGVYVFFIRYKIRKDVYTNWFLCSRPIFGGTSEKITTLQGGLSYINLHKDSAKSFVFQLDFVNEIEQNRDKYKEFQLGFIITHDEATDARIWKHFNISDFVVTKPHYHESGYDDENLIYFDYEDVKEANIDDLLETTYELYNVRNVTAFKNKLYISNYIESNFNPDELNTLANCVSLTEVHSRGSDLNYKNLKLHGVDLSYNDTKGYYDSLAGGGNILSYLARDSFNYDITKLSKTNTKEKQDIVKFDIIWKSDYNPDIAIVYNIYNYIYEKQIFGPDYAEPYIFTEYFGHIYEGLGIKQVAEGNNLWVYQRSTNKHPWDDLGLTFAFGSFSTNDSGKNYARQGCSYFNKFSYGQWGIDPTFGWVTRDSGFTTAARSAMITKLKEDIANKSFWGKAYLEVTSGANIYTIDYQDRMDLDNYAGYGSDIVTLSDSYFSIETISDYLKNRIQGWVYNAISDSNIFKGIDENGTPIIVINGEEIRVNSISVKFKKFEFSLETDDAEDTEENIYKHCRVTLQTTDYVSLCTFIIKSSALNVSDTAGNAVQASTLMPLSTYQPYIHFVDEHNIITNGIKLPKVKTYAAQSDTDIITLNYAISNLPTNNYKSFFISLANIGDLVIEGFDYTKDPNNSNRHIIHCIEIDTMLYNINDNITIKNASGTTITTTAKYYSSGSNYPPLAFGNCGYVSWEDTTSSYANSRLYIIITRNKASENINELVKASSYIPLANTTDTAIPDGYYGSWLCLVKKPSFTLSSSCYVSGKDVYAVNRTAALSLSEFKSFIQVQDSVTYFVRSNFNLNYLSLTEDITDTIFTVGAASAGVKQVAKVINSAILSFIYELKSMYKDFSNKYFRPYDTDYKIDFDNTIRVSHVLSDETFNNSIFKFSAEDYYNVPTDRGIIVNLFSIGNNIFVHTKLGFYKFDANQTIMASNEDITLQESEPFEIGISQIFDSEFGYGGINNKEAGCITFDSYFFYDQFSNHIFAYSGNGQVQLIDGSINKLLTIYKPIFCRTLHDDANHRILFEFITSKYDSFTLSFNYKAKSFVSFHDITLENAFASRNSAYSYKSSICKLFDTTNDITTQIYDKDLNLLNIFGGATKACIIRFGATTQPGIGTSFGVAVLIYPREFVRENVEFVTIDANTIQTPIVNIEEEIEGVDEAPHSYYYDLIEVPQHLRVNPINKMFIITDCCVSTPVTGTVDDTKRPDSLKDNPSIPNALLDYKGFKYDAGSWNSDYFRNALNDDNVYGYPNQPRYGQTPNSDNNSLVYGKYFIIVLDFITSTPIKLENIFINTNKY